MERVEIRKSWDRDVDNRIFRDLRFMIYDFQLFIPNVVTSMAQKNSVNRCESVSNRQCFEKTKPISVSPHHCWGVKKESLAGICTDKASARPKGLEPSTFGSTVSIAPSLFERGCVFSTLSRF